MWLIKNTWSCCDGQNMSTKYEIIKIFFSFEVWRYNLVIALSLYKVYSKQKKAGEKKSCCIASFYANIPNASPQIQEAHIAIGKVCQQLLTNPNIKSILWSSWPMHYIYTTCLWSVKVSSIELSGLLQGKYLPFWEQTQSICYCVMSSRPERMANQGGKCWNQTYK